MRYTVRVDGRPLELEVLDRAGGTVIRHGGREIPVSLRRLRGDGASTLRMGGRTHCVVVEEGVEDRIVTVGSRAYRVEVEDEREAAAHAVRPAGGDGPRVLRSAMPGIVRTLNVTEGDAVEVKTALLVLEAMKMQNEVRADRAGTVRKIHVAAGSTVAKGDPLVTIG